MRGRRRVTLWLDCMTCNARTMALRAVLCAVSMALGCAPGGRGTAHGESKRLLVETEWDGSLRGTPPLGEPFVHSSIGLLETVVGESVTDPARARPITSRCLALAHGVRLTREEPLRYDGVDGEWMGAERFATKACRELFGTNFRIPTVQEVEAVYGAAPQGLGFVPRTLVALDRGQPVLVRLSQPGCRAPLLLDGRPNRTSSADRCLAPPKIERVTSERANVVCRGPATRWREITREEVVDCAERFATLGGVDPRAHAPHLPVALATLAFDVHAACSSPSESPEVWARLRAELERHAGAEPLPQRVLAASASGDAARWQYLYFLSALVDTADRCAESSTSATRLERARLQNE